MNSILQDIPWRSHLLGLIALCISLAVFGVALNRYLAAQHELEVATNQYRQQQSINSVADQSKQTLDAHMARYRHWQEQGLIGEAPRLAWIETLKTIQERFKVPVLEYTLEGTSNATEENSTFWNDSLVVEVTPLKLTMDMLHEGDFFHFMTALRKQAPSLFDMPDCQLRRQSGSDAGLGLRAECQLLWYNLRDLTREWEVQDESLGVSQIEVGQ